LISLFMIPGIGCAIGRRVCARGRGGHSRVEERMGRSTMDTKARCLNVWTVTELRRSPELGQYSLWQVSSVISDPKNNEKGGQIRCTPRS
jgi:hypothetical protein